LINFEKTIVNQSQSIMKKIIILFIIIFFLAGCKPTEQSQKSKAVIENSDTSHLTYKLPAPRVVGVKSVEESINTRRSHRNFIDKELTVDQLSQILWAAYGVTKPRSDYPFLRGGLRTAPSAGALYPLEIYVLVGKVNGIEPGLYRYISQDHKIVRTIDKDLRKELCTATYNQQMIADAPAVLFYSAIYSRCTSKYGSRGRERYVCMDLGHSAENVYLQAEALNLGTCAIAAFNDKLVSKFLQLPKEEEPLYIMPIGYYLNETGL